MDKSKELIQQLMDSGISPETLEKVAMELKPNALGLEMTEYRKTMMYHKFKSVDKYTSQFRDWCWEEYKDRQQFMSLLIAVEQQHELLRMLYNWAVTDGLIKGDKLKWKN
jgi:hypothetical protein